VKPADVSGIKTGISERKSSQFPIYSTNMNIRVMFKGISEWKKSCQHRKNMVMDETGHLFAYSHNI
jgi:hypothetical protein